MESRRKETLASITFYHCKFNRRTISNSQLCLYFSYLLYVDSLEPYKLAVLQHCKNNHRLLLACDAVLKLEMPITFSQNHQTDAEEDKLL